MKLDLRNRCPHCKKLIRSSARAQADYSRYAPFCSYHCQEWGHLKAAAAHLKTLR